LADLFFFIFSLFIFILVPIPSIFFLSIISFISWGHSATSSTNLYPTHQPKCPTDQLPPTQLINYLCPTHQLTCLSNLYPPPLPNSSPNIPLLINYHLPKSSTTTHPTDQLTSPIYQTNLKRSTSLTPNIFYKSPNLFPFLRIGRPLCMIKNVEHTPVLF